MGPTGRVLPTIPEPSVLQHHGPARVLAMCNQKGGVGKTTTTINLGAALAELGRRVLLVDFDPQGALSVGLGVNPLQLDRTVYNLLMERDVTVDDILLKTSVAGMDLSAQQHRPLGRRGATGQRGGARADPRPGARSPVLNDYDVVLIDCQPSLGLLTVNALTASHGVLIPLECEYFALRGVALLIQTIDKIRERLNPQLEVEGILATMYDSRTTHGREVLARVVDAFGDTVFHTVISRTVRFPETTVAGEPITTFAPASNGCHRVPRSREGGACTVPRRVSLPGAAELFRVTGDLEPAKAPTAPAPAQRTEPTPDPRRRPRFRGSPPPPGERHRARCHWHRH